MNNNPLHVVLGSERFPVRFSYANVWEPRSFNNQEAKYSVSVLINKNDVESINKVNAAIQAVFNDTKGKTDLADKSGHINPQTLWIPFRDGDVEKPDLPEYRGHYFINAKSNSKPRIVDGNVQDIMVREQFYSGCYGRVGITFYSFNNSGNRGIGASLTNLQKLMDGDPLAGGPSAEDDFGPAQPQQAAYGQQAPAAPQYGQPAPQPQYGQPTPQPQYNPNQAPAPTQQPGNQPPVNPYVPQQPPTQQGYAPQQAPAAPQYGQQPPQKDPLG